MFLPKFEEEELIFYLPLEGLIKKRAGYNFRCPVCGDSKISPKKKRGWILTGKDHLVYYCFNCGYCASFRNFLKEYFPDVFEIYQEKIRSYFNSSKKTLVFEPKQEFIIQSKEDKGEFITKPLSEFKFVPVNESSEHVKFLKKRKIPKNSWKYFFIDLDKSSKYYFWLIIPFFKDSNTIFGFQARNIYQKEFRTELFSDKNLKVWNLFNVDLSKDIFVFEGVFDAVFVNNSIAMLGADLTKEITKFIPKEKLVFVFDNDLTGIQKTEKYLKEGFRCVIFPNNFLYKDINDWVINEKPPLNRIEKFLYDNVFSNTTYVQTLLKVKRRILKAKI